MADYNRDMKRWLEMSRDDVFTKFANWGGDRVVDRGTGDDRFLYIPGTRKDRVVMIAHADTVFSKEIKVNYDAKLQKYYSAQDDVGIGADDRAGCAMLWALRDLGHSILIIGNEEHGVTSPEIMKYHTDIAKELNEHQFMVQFDRCNATDYKCYDVGSDDFREYVESEMLGYSEPNRSSFTDIKTLCDKICGVNLSVGYYNEHTADEYLLMRWWRNTMYMAKRWLSKKHLPKYKLEKVVYTYSKKYSWKDNFVKKDAKYYDDVFAKKDSKPFTTSDYDSLRDLDAKQDLTVEDSSSSYYEDFYGKRQKRIGYTYKSPEERTMDVDSEIDSDDMHTIADKFVEGKKDDDDDDDYQPRKWWKNPDKADKKEDDSVDDILKDLEVNDDAPTNEFDEDIEKLVQANEDNDDDNLLITYPNDDKPTF